MPAAGRQTNASLWRPTTPGLPWRAWLLLSGMVLLLMAALTWAQRPVHLAFSMAVAVTVVGSLAALCGAVAIIWQRQRARRGLALGGERRQALLVPAVFVLLLAAVVAALLPVPAPSAWVNSMLPVLMFAGALWLGWQRMRAAAPIEFEEAQRAHREGDSDAALTLLERLESQRPDFAGTHHLRAVIHRERGNYAEAQVASRRLIALRPDVYYGHADLGLALLSEGHPAEAREPLRRATQVAPELAEGHYNLGMACVETGDQLGAEESLGRALRLGLRDGVTEMMARYHLCVSAQALGHVAQAQAELRRLQRRARALRRWRADLADSALAPTQRRKELALIAAIECIIKARRPVKG